MLQHLLNATSSEFRYPILSRKEYHDHVHKIHQNRSMLRHVAILGHVWHVGWLSAIYGNIHYTYPKYLHTVIELLRIFISDTESHFKANKKNNETDLQILETFQFGLESQNFHI